MFHKIDPWHSPDTQQTGSATSHAVSPLWQSVHLSGSMVVQLDMRWQ
jgi:hypothetical protein